MLNKTAAFITLTAVVFYAALIAASTYWTLGGNIYEYVRPGGGMGAPANLIRNGFHITLDKQGSGWDGSFYYYIADDILILKDTLLHLDMPAYRYQRIGLGLAAKFISLVTLSKWVSPIHYLIASLVIILGAIYTSAVFLDRRGVNARWILAWAVSGAPLFTLLYAFTDGAADALIALAIVALLTENFLFFLAFSTLATLCRESFVLLPVAAGLTAAICQLIAAGGVQQRIRRSVLAGAACLPPVIIAGAWQAYIVAKTGNLPSHFTPVTQFATPFTSAFKYMKQAFGYEIESVYPNSSPWYPGYIPAFGIVLFLALNVTVIIALTNRKALSFQEPALSGVSIFAIGTAAVNLCFGDVMMWVPVGYVKAASTQCLLPFLLAAVAPLRMRQAVFYLASANGIFGGLIVWLRLFPTGMPQG